MSLSYGVMPEALKVAELLPALKKLGADYKQFSNFRPISNLKMVSKVIEKAAAVQLINHFTTHLLDEASSFHRDCSRQSAERHSTRY